MGYFPVCLEISGRRCVVIGGGRVAARKAMGLLQHHARVTVISPELTAELTDLHAAGELEWLARPYRDGDLEGAFLAIAATDDPAAQEAAQAEADRHQILLNVADVPHRCNFILPATVRRGDLTIAVSTGGKSPALAKRLRQEFEEQFGPEYGVVVDLLGRLRPEVLAQGRPHTENRVLFEDLLHRDMPLWVRQRRWDAFEAHIRHVLGETISPDCLIALRAEFERPLAESETHE